ncbi:MmyB family transcriptional regulator [Nocardia sp. NPDC004278]
MPANPQAGMTGTPAYVRNARMDIVAANTLCTVLYEGILDPGVLPVNLPRFVFLDGRSHEFFADGDTMADHIVSTLCAPRPAAPPPTGPSAT